MTITLPEIELPALLVLVGPGGAGKSRVAKAFPPGWRLELDAMRQAVSDCGGNQSSTPDALAVFHPMLEGRLRRRLPVVVDATSTRRADRTSLLDRARAHGMPAVAIVVRTPLATCQTRQQVRPPTRQVPDDVIVQQHAGTPSVEQLHEEGFAAAHYADRLDLMRLLLQRSTAAGPDPLADVRARFGADLADVFAWHDDSDFVTGAFAVAGREVTVRWWAEGDPYEHHWQARTECPEGCPGPAWVRVTGAADLLDVYGGGLPDEPWCDGCDGCEGPGLAELH